MLPALQLSCCEYGYNVNPRMLFLALFIFQISSEGCINENCALNIIAHEVGKKVAVLSLINRL